MPISLKGIQALLKDLDLTGHILEKSEEVHQDLLVTDFEDTDLESPTFVFTILPLDEDLDGSQFIQLYYEYPFQYVGLIPNELKNVINNSNRQLPLGHFNLAVTGQQIYYKYVLAFPTDAVMNVDTLSDVLDMCLFGIENFEEDFKVFATVSDN